MPNEHTTLGALFTDIASAIREKSGSTGTIKADDFPDEIRAIPTGEEDAEQKDVNFYGLNAHRMYSYTLAEIAALTALPPLPTKDVNGVAMTYDWCMTLAEVKALTADDVPYNICVAAHPTDGATHIHVRITEKTKTRQIQFMKLSGTETVEIDWGDGSTHWTGTDSIINPTHTWSDAGEYDVRVWGGVRCRYTTHLFNADNTAENETVFAVELGKDFGFTTSSLLTGYNYFPVRGIESLTISAVTDIPGYFLFYATNLRKITIPSSVKRIGYSTFRSGNEQTTRIEKAVMPSGATVSGDTGNYGNQMEGTLVEEGNALTNTSGGTSILPYGFFKNCKRLKKSIIPKRTTNIGASAYSGCGKLREIVIPENVGAIYSSAFSGNTCLEKIIFTRATPPNLLASTSLSLPKTCEIYVPRGSLSAYTSATNYPSADTYTYVEY